MTLVLEQEQILNTVLNTDAINGLKQIPDNFIDCVVTSPPYWALRKYDVPVLWDVDPNCEHEFSIHTMKKTNGAKSSTVGNNMKGLASFSSSSNFCTKCNAWQGELGLEPSFELYITHLLQIFDQVKRVLKKEGACWVVIGDTYAAGTRGRTKGDSLREKHHEYRKDIPLSEGSPNRMGCGIIEKSLCLLPERFAIGMIEHGWILRNEVIWHKRNCMPSSAMDRFTNNYEHVYFFVKSKKYYFNTQYEPYQTHENRPMGLFRSRNWDYNSKHSDNNYYGHQNKNKKKVGGEERLTRIKRTVWTINTMPFPEAHFAIFPEKLVETPVKATCPEGGILLDPFLGSGTSALVALKMNRNFIGIEPKTDYLKIIEKRIDPYLHSKQMRLM